MQGKHKLRAERNERHLTQKALGNEAGVSASTISSIECHRGPDVPQDQLRTTKTRLSTALKLTVALAQIAPGEYSFEEYIALQQLFTEAELYEAMVNQLEREQKKNRRGRRHLSLVA